jgi:DNA-directed RNA polymerase specialized sigma24 family protein
VSADQLCQAADTGLAGLFRRHHVDLVRLAVLVVGDQPTAEDVVQDVFTGLHASGGRAGRPGEELACVRACVINRCRSVLRRRGRLQPARPHS